ncbi:MAG: hypothetical protein WCX88_03020 [Patescibacteria group bacterium]
MKNETKHTQGPWQVVNTDTSEYSVIAPGKIINYGSGEEAVIVMHTPQGQLPGDDGENAANAALIAAAPDLLAALETIYENKTRSTTPLEYVEWTATLKQVRAAIAKAKGGEIKREPVRA